jgi:WD40 repeat protein/tetratricopeptide (TPR) repeat protein
MNQCPDQELLERLLDNRLAGTELDELDRHVKACASCQQTLETLTDDSLWKSELRKEVTLVLGDSEPARAGNRLGTTDGAAGTDPERMGRIEPTVPGYEITGELGRGGMGVVYHARHVRLNRTCALKMVLAGAHASPEHVARFVTEAEAIARIQHPSIVQIRHIGDCDGLPFLELEYLAGGNLHQQLDGTPWPATKAARLAEQLALGVAEAHRQGIVHRDLKPSNVLQAADSTPKVGDFGLAKMLDSQAVLTQSESVMGSPSYMAPEQASGHARDAGPAVDIYALGAILYELLTGRPPFRGTTPLETLEQVKSTEPVSPSRLVPGLPRDIETICLKCLQKGPGKRYETAQALGDDLRRFLDGRPILARRTSGVERAWRWCRRNRLVAGMTAIAAALFLIVGIGSPLAAWRFHIEEARTEKALREKSDAEREAKLRAVDGFYSNLNEARAARFSRQVGQRFQGLAAIERAVEIGRGLDLPPDKFDLLRDQAIACLALPDVRSTGRVIAQPDGTFAFCFDAGMNRYALRDRSGTILVRRVADDQELVRLRAQGNRDIFVFAFSPDGRYLMTTQYPGPTLTVWDVDRNAIAVADQGRVVGTAARFSPDSRRIALAHPGGEILIYNLEKTGTPRRFKSGLRDIQDLAFRGDGLEIAVTNRDATQPQCRILEVESGRAVQTIALRSPGSVAWGSGGTTLATAGDDRKIELWDAPSGISRARLEGSANAGLHAAFHPAGNLLASNGWESRLRIWDAVLGRPVLSVTGTSPTTPAFSRDGRIVLLSEGRLTTYQVDPALEYRSLVHTSSEPMSYQRPSIRRDNRLLAVGAETGVVLWDLKSGTECAFLPMRSAREVMFEANGDLLTSGPAGVRRWPVQLDAGRNEFRIGPAIALPFSFNTGHLAADRPGRVIATPRHSYAEVQASGRLTQVGPLEDCRYVAVSPDGEWLATGSHHIGAQVWRVSDGGKVKELPVNMGRWIAFSPDGKWLMTGNPPCKFWSTGTWALARELGGAGLCFSPEGRLVALLDASKIIRLVEVETGRVIARLESPDSSDVVFATFSPDGSSLVLVPGNYPAVHVWDLRAIRKRLAAMGLDWDAPALPDDDTAAAALPLLHVDLQDYSAYSVAHIERYSARLKDDSNDADSSIGRGYAYRSLGRYDKAIDDFTVALRLRPGQALVRYYRGEAFWRLGQYEPAIADMEAALARDSQRPLFREHLALCCDERAWKLVTGPKSARDPQRALRLARRAVELYPGDWSYLNTLGVVEFRAGQYAESIATMERSLKAGPGKDDAVDLFFMAMAHHQLGHRTQARECYDRALRWQAAQKSLSAARARDLAAFRAEAEAVLAGPAGELPADVFATPPAPK